MSQPVQYWDATDAHSRLAWDEKAAAHLIRSRRAQRAAIDELAVWPPLSAPCWLHAADWVYDDTELQTLDIRRFLERYGYALDDRYHWRAAAESTRPRLEIRLEKNIENVGHTWYILICKLLPGAQVGGATLTWHAPRRLTQLRDGLHDRVKASMGNAYAAHFQDAPFAKLGGPRGTTDRLSAWLQRLAYAANEPKLTPESVALVLTFLTIHALETPANSAAQAPMGVRGIDPSDIETDQFDDSPVGRIDHYSPTEGVRENGRDARFSPRARLVGKDEAAAVEMSGTQRKQQPPPSSGKGSDGGYAGPVLVAACSAPEAGPNDVAFVCSFGSEVARLGFSVAWESEWPQVLKVDADGAAKQRGIVAGDRVIEMNGTSTRGRTRDELMPLLKLRPLKLSVVRSADASGS